MFEVSLRPRLRLPPVVDGSVRGGGGRGGRRGGSGSGSDEGSLLGGGEVEPDLVFGSGEILQEG